MWRVPSAPPSGSLTKRLKSTGPSTDSWAHLWVSASTWTYLKPGKTICFQSTSLSIIYSKLNQFVHTSTSLFPLFEKLNRSFWVYILERPTPMPWVWFKPEIQQWWAGRCQDPTAQNSPLSLIFLSQYSPGHHLPVFFLWKWHLGSTWNVVPFKKRRVSCLSLVQSTREGLG